MSIDICIKCEQQLDKDYVPCHMMLEGQIKDGKFNDTLGDVICEPCYEVFLENQEPIDDRTEEDSSAMSYGERKEEFRLREAERNGDSEGD